MHVIQDTLTQDSCSRSDSPGAQAEAPVRARVAAIDVIRGVALFGVLLVNLTTEFRVSIFQQFLGTTAADSGVDLLFARVVSAGLESKAFALFSILFGVGLAIQFERLTRRGRPFYWLVRRLVILLVFGLVHLLLVWNGDILTEYAIVGLFALPFLKLRTRYLGAAAVAFLLVYATQSSIWSVAWPSTAMLVEHVAASNRIYSTGDWAQIMQFSHHELPLLLPLHLYVLPRTIALFLFGMCFWRTGVFTAPAKFKNQNRLVAALCVLAGAGTLALPDGGWLTSALREGALNVAQVILAVGYAAAILVLLEFPGVAKVLGLFAPLGRMAFTNYLLQSVLCGFIFFGFGLGQFGHMAVAPAFAVGVMIYLWQMALSYVWLKYYRFGPVEWVWRTLMYGEMQPMMVKR